VLVLFDNNIPRGLAQALKAHTVTEARARNWHLLKNGELLQAAEDAAFDVMVTSDKGIKYQQNLTGRKIALVVFKSGTMETDTAAARSHCSSRRCGHAGQLYRSRTSGRVSPLLPDFLYRDTNPAPHRHNPRPLRTRSRTTTPQTSRRA